MNARCRILCVFGAEATLARKEVEKLVEVMNDAVRTVFLGQLELQPAGVLRADRSGETGLLRADDIAFQVIADKAALFRTNTGFAECQEIDRGVRLSEHSDRRLLYRAEQVANPVAVEPLVDFDRPDQIADDADLITACAQFPDSFNALFHHNTFAFCPAEAVGQLNSRLFDAISAKTSDYLVISAIVTEKEELEKANCDLIISTMQPDVKLNVPVIIVSPIITPKDIKNIMIRISEIRSEKKKKDFRIKLSTLITEDLFILQKDPLSKEECIHLMAENLKKHGYVSDSFESEIIERDSVSSVAFENFAIPHAMKMHEKKTGISVMIADEPVLWDDVKAELIMMLCFNINERYLFNELFEPISMILIEPDNIAKVLQARSSEEFVQILSDLLP